MAETLFSSWVVKALNVKDEILRRALKLEADTDAAIAALITTEDGQVLTGKADYVVADRDNEN